MGFNTVFKANNINFITVLCFTDIIYGNVFSLLKLCTIANKMKNFLSKWILKFIFWLVHKKLDKILWFLFKKYKNQLRILIKVKLKKFLVWSASVFNLKNNS